MAILYSSVFRYTIQEAFDAIPNADAIVFNIETVDVRTKRRVNQRIKRVRWYNALSYSAAWISVCSVSIKGENILLHSCFGGVTCYNAGEDVLFVVDMPNTAYVCIHTLCVSYK